MLTYTDNITQKTITYKPNCLFTIETRSRFNSRVVKKVFNAERINEAFNEFYALFVQNGHYKYLYMRPQEKGHPEVLILRMRGYASKVEVENIVLKNKISKQKMTTTSIGNLTKCPSSLALELSSQDYSDYPTSLSRWTMSKLAYALFAYIVSLPREERNALLFKADKELLKHKELSGFSTESDNFIKVDVVTKDDLL